MSLADRIRTLREQRGLNQKGLADASGITQATISRIESGQVEELKSESLKNLATALGVTVDYVVGKTDRLGPAEFAEADPRAAELLRHYAGLGEIGKREVLDFARYLRQRQRVGKDKPVLRLLAAKMRQRQDKSRSRLIFRRKPVG